MGFSHGSGEKRAARTRKETTQEDVQEEARQPVIKRKSEADEELERKRLRLEGMRQPDMPQPTDSMIKTDGSAFSSTNSSSSS